MLADNFKPVYSLYLQALTVVQAWKYSLSFTPHNVLQRKEKYIIHVSVYEMQSSYSLLSCIRLQITPIMS